MWRKAKVFIIMFFILLWSTSFVKAEIVTDEITDVRISWMEHTLPELKVYFNFYNEDIFGIEAKLKEEDIRISIDGEVYESGVLEKASVHPVKTNTLFLIDTSSEMSIENIKKVKTFIANWVDKKSPGDEVAIFVVDETIKELQDFTDDESILLEATEEIRISDKDAIYLSGMMQSIQKAKKKKFAKVEERLEDSQTILISFATGSNTSQKEVKIKEIENVMKINNIPVYVVGMKDNLTTKQAEVLESLRELAIISGGRYYERNENHTNLFEEIQNIFRTQYVYTISTSFSNVDQEEKVVSLYIENQDMSLVDKHVFINTRRFVDTVVPKVESYTYNQKAGLLTIQVTEPVSSSNPMESVTIADEKGKEVKIKKVAYQEKQILVYIQDVETGQYQVKLQNIFDESLEKNPLQYDEIVFGKEKEKILLEKPKNPPEITKEEAAIEAFLIYFFKENRVATIIVVSIIGCSALSGVYISRRKKRKGGNVKLHLIYKDHGTGKEKSFHTKISTEDTIVGSRKDCDLYIDRKEMGKQHFAIYRNTQRVMVRELKDGNGTTIDGVRVSEPMELKEKGEIEAGNTSFLYEIEKKGRI